MIRRVVYWLLAIVLVAVLFVMGFVWFLSRGAENVVPSPLNGSATSTTSTQPDGSSTTAGMVSVARIALLNPEGTAGTRRGCDELVFVMKSIMPTRAPLTAAMRELFSTNPEGPTGTFSFIAKSNAAAAEMSRRKLQFDRATVDPDGTARIYLMGDVVYAGVCDDPRLRIQVEETAKQFLTVKKVEIYLNGKLYQDPSGRG